MRKLQTPIHSAAKANAPNHSLAPVGRLKRNQLGFGGGSLAKQTRKRRRFAVCVQALHSVNQVRFVGQLHLTWQPETASDTYSHVAIGSGHDELVDQGPNRGEVDVGIVISVEAAD